MERLFLISCLAILFLQGHAQDGDPVAVNFVDNTAQTLQVGAENVQFTCFLNQPVNYILQGDVDTFLVKEWNGQITEKHLFSNIKRVDASPEFYDMNYENVDGGLEFTLTMLSVRHEDDGKLVCRTESGGIVVSDEVPITVYKNLEKVHLQFADTPAVMQDVTDPVEVDVGEYPVMCVAEGSNPATTDIKLYLKGDEFVATGEPVTEPMPGDIRMYKSTVNTRMAITVEHSGHSVECTATSPAGNSITVKIPIKVKVYDPKIECNDAEAYPGKRYVTMTCTVDHTDISVDGYYYRIGDTGVIIRDGNDQEVEGKVIMVKKEDKSPTISELHLELYEAQDWHFSTDFVLVVESAGGHLTEGRVNFQKMDDKGAENGSSSPDDNGSGPEDSSAMLTASVATVLLSFLLAVYARVL